MFTSKISGIYIIKNIVNNKVYIGQSVNVIRRNKAELNGRSINSYFLSDYKKYGRDAFSASLLESIHYKNKTLMNEREKYWILKYNSTNEKYGYNISPGCDIRHSKITGSNRISGNGFRYNYIEFLENKDMGKRISFVVKEEDYERLIKACSDKKYLSYCICEAINAWISRVDLNEYKRYLTQLKYLDLNKDKEGGK